MATARRRPASMPASPDESGEEGGRQVGMYFTSAKEHLKFVSSGSTLLDGALGGGWVLGRIANIIGDKCLSGDTIVSAKRGTKPRKMTINTLHERVNGSHHNRNSDLETFLVADVGGYVGLVPMISVQKTGMKVLYEITDDKGNSIKASEDHQFSTVMGWRRLSDHDGLKEGTEVKYWRSSRDKSEKGYVLKERPYTYSIPFHPFGQQNVVAGRDYKRLPTARLLIEAAINGMSLHELIKVLRKDEARAAALQYSDPTKDVHHLNGDPSDNRLSNLLLIDPPDHWAEHASEMAPNTRAIEVSKIKSIKKIGRQLTFDITMTAPYHNFIANGFVVHNSTGKTLQAIETSANFAKAYPRGKIYYRERESAFDAKYAAALGMPLRRVDFGPDGDKRFDTVEGFHADLLGVIAKCKTGSHPGLYILDSLDSLSDAAEMASEVGDATYGIAKAKAMSQMFRKLVRPLEDAEVLLMIISQIRDKIGVKFGKKTTRTGGHALDFYATHVIELAHLGHIMRERGGVKRSIGIEVRAKVAKNKVALPQREAQYDLLFGYGVDDMGSCLDWLKEIGRLAALGITSDKEAVKYLQEADAMNDNDYRARCQEVRETTKVVWRDIENKFLPTRRKYS